MAPKEKTAQPHQRLGEILRANRASFAEAIAGAVESIPRWRINATEFTGTRAEYLALNFEALADYAGRYFATGDKVYLQLFLGEMIKALYVANESVETSRKTTELVMSDLLVRVEAALSRLLKPEELAIVVKFVSDITRSLTAETPKSQKVLLVGDCLFLDIISFVVGDLLDVGTRVIPEYATSKNPALLRDELRQQGSTKFDLVFFSPFTYEFSLEFSHLLDWRNSFKGRQEVEAVVDRTWDDARSTIELLSDLFDCPIYIHNSSALVREDSLPKRIMKSKATVALRRIARDRVNSLLTKYIDERNKASFQHLYLLDELPAVEKAGELEAGSYLYKSALQHPAALGKLLSKEYLDIIYVNSWLLKRKVVVCDLDNTLWDGVIGEGKVNHYHRRQSVLKALKAKGVLLAINSKNDPSNVHWAGGILNEDDFVCAAISWDPKVVGMRRIQDALNLKIKDFVFVDDREDERELVKSKYPDVLCLDATDPHVWSRFALWERLLEDDQDMDRTQMYKQRDARKAFIKEDVSSPEERAALFGALELRVRITPAGSADLKRVAELINRTNQFNLEGSRTTFKEVSSWLGSSDHVILLGHTSDRFGEMGTTCIAVVCFTESEAKILPFVLSCRVFGYGIEYSVMNHLKRLAQQRGVRRIVGRYIPTQLNAPSKDFLKESGFSPFGDEWVFDLTGPVHLSDPEWLKVEVQG